MSNSGDKSFGELTADIRELIEETVGLLQKNERLRVPNSPGVRTRASHHMSGITSRTHDTMNPFEMTSIRALLIWSANEQNAAPEIVKAATEVHFGVDDVEKLPRRSYEDVIKFLIDLRLDEMKN